MPKDYRDLNQFVLRKKDEVIYNIQLSRIGYINGLSEQTCLTAERQNSYQIAYQKQLKQTIKQAKILISDDKVDYLLEKIIAKDRMRKASDLCFDFHQLDARIKYLQLNCLSLAEFYNQVVELSYANCTSQAMCLCHLLEQAGLETRLFGITNYHDVTIVLGLDKQSVIISDPWADYQFEIQLDHKMNSLNEILHPEKYDKVITVLAQYYPFIEKYIDDTVTCTFSIRDPNQYLRKVAAKRTYQTKNDSEIKQINLMPDEQSKEKIYTF
ncbi:MAG: hypothetical protein EP298_01100 [Gammaproteobacteria bacterium]|nr:MAG: hypothetical protein EP298_01100 [Gammaproteobacteria bacterium]UTW41948.1 hypothetical protein KFE69_10610 [bacterium SCSIO 12844]